MTCPQRAHFWPVSPSRVSNFRHSCRPRLHCRSFAMTISPLLRMERTASQGAKRGGLAHGGGAVGRDTPKARPMTGFEPRLSADWSLCCQIAPRLDVRLIWGLPQADFDCPPLRDQFLALVESNRPLRARPDARAVQTALGLHRRTPAPSARRAGSSVRFYVRRRRSRMDESELTHEYPRAFPFLGTVVWLTSEQSGRSSGPPVSPMVRTAQPRVSSRLGQPTTA
jgi:hypothetical protein